MRLYASSSSECSRAYGRTNGFSLSLVLPGFSAATLWRNAASSACVCSLGPRLRTRLTAAAVDGFELTVARSHRRASPVVLLNLVSSVVAPELDYGAFKSQRVERNVALVDALQFEVVEFDSDDAREAGPSLRCSALAEHLLVQMTS